MQASPSVPQAAPAATQSLLDKAHALEVRGRMDMAAQTWQQVLLADPNNTEALGGLARAARLSGNMPLAQTYIERLKAINPNDPGIARAETMGTQSDNNAELNQAGKLAQQGNYAQAMALYRKQYGDSPPPGDIALAYYETEAATEDGRPHAIAGLRNLSARNPGDSRYQIALGRILTYNPKTRAEGRKLLEEHPGDPQALEALRQSLLWDAQNPATSGDIRLYLERHPDAQLAAALKNLPRTGGNPGRPAPQLTPEQRAAAAAVASRNAEERAAYAALNAKHIEEAEQKFKEILARNPDSPNALAGMGYIRMQQANFGGAISFLAQAKQDGSKDPALEGALTTSRFWYTMGEGATALNENDLPGAEKQYRLALGMRPDSVEALEGLGGTLLKAQQPEAAAPYFARFVKLKPSAPHAWRGLFLAQFGAGDAPHALATEKAMPKEVRAELYKDPLYLRALSSAFTGVGDDADAQKVIRIALDLPFPADAHGLEAETQLQYAGLLQAANHLDQAAALYRQVLAKDQNNTDAWQGLVRTQHAMGQDQQALQTIESMPPASYAKVMRDAGFDVTVASLYESQKRYDVAQEILEKTIAQQVSTGQKPAAATQLQLAGVYMERNNSQAAYPIYQQLLTEYPDRTEAWKGLLSALHNTGRDSEAIAEIQQIPPPTRAQLENDVDFLQTMGATYSQLGQPQEASLFLHRVQEHYALQHALPPADVDIQNAWLLYNGMNDAGLDRQLLMLGGRNDLSDAQRRTVQTIWANWAVRRANQAAAKGDTRRALAILNATARAFPDNPGVIKALAGGYSRAGMTKQAVLIWKSQDMNAAPASDYKAAIGAALADGDTKDAENWLRFALDQYPKDPDLLNLGAKFEAATGNTNRAIDYYRASLDAMPPPDPGAQLATMLSQPVPMTNAQLPSAKSGQDLASLLAPGPNDKPAPDQTPEPPVSTQPYLPSYGTADAPVQLYTSPGQMYAPATPSAPAVPSYMNAPEPATKTPAPADNAPHTRLRDYVPQASLDEPLPADATRLPPSVALAYTDFSGPEVTPAVYQQQQITRLTLQAQGGSQQAVGTKPLPLTEHPSGPVAESETASQTGAQAAPVVDPATGEVYGPFVPYKPTTVTLNTSKPAASAASQREVTDVLPTARYVPNARTDKSGSLQSDANAVHAAAIRSHQSDPPLTGESKPPVEDYTTAPTEAAQYTGQPYGSQGNGTQQSGGQVAQPAQNGNVQYSNQSGNSQPYYPPQQQSYPPQQQQNGDSSAQQYPQPNTGRTSSSPARGRVRSRPAAPAAPAPEPAAETPAPPPPVQSGLSYPGVGTPLTYQPYPTIGPAYPLGPAPTDQDLMAQHLPPLRGNYYTGAILAPQVPLTPRQITERDVAQLEASYSGWIGGTASARYRSGTAGLDSLTDLESTVEASATIGNSVRLSIIPRAVFLNNGTLNVGNYAGLTSGVPVLGTLPANAANAPAAQSASGVGGEFQLATRTFAAAVGYTPYEFLIRNFTGRALFKPSNHFTLYFNRDSVVETELSYSGLRDPGTASAVYPGNIWGGVVATGGGVRFDTGDEKAGFYITVDGSDITGYHVLDNTKFEGSMGAYFLAHTFPGYGKINVGASLFGMHFAQNELGLSYGLGGYFSPDAYFLASVPITYTGRYGDNFHYTIAGSLGVQSFQEDSQLFFPLDRGLQSSYASSANNGLACTSAQTAAHTCAQYPNVSNTGANYGFNTEGSYRITDHWFGGGFLSANNTNNYNTVTGGFFVRYLFRPQVGNEDSPTGMFPVEGFRPLRVP
jgi:tetratricopeptide (TPR) repeat protein